MKKYCLIFCFSVFSWIVYPVSCLAADWDISSETILRTFQRDTTKGDDRNVLPLYEYLSVDYGDTEEGGISFQGYGWVRKDVTENESYKDDHHKKNQSHQDDKRNRNTIEIAVLVELRSSDKENCDEGDEKEETDQAKNQPPQE